MDIAIGIMGGLGLFLYGMNLMGDGLQKSAGSKLKRIIELLTSNVIMGVLVGMVVTMIIQSSSATTVMVVGFVNAGIMSLPQAIGVIMGANIGTTITAQIVSLDISGLAPMALGIGISHVLGDRHSQENSFGLVALCSIGPMLAVLVLGIFARNDLSYTVNYSTVDENILRTTLQSAANVAKEVAIALGLIVFFFILCQIFFLKLQKIQLLKIGIGVAFTYVGLVMFLTGVNVGYMPVGYKMGIQLASLHPAILVGIGLVMGILVVLAEPAVHVLNSQVEDVTGGYVKKKSMMIGLCAGVGAAIALSVIRIIFDFSLVYYIIPGYFISLALSLFVPPVYTAIAFDSGGVASGPMTSGFILPFAIGVCVALQGENAVLRDGFGVVALVAMTPLITIQLLGFKAIISNKIKEHRAMRRIVQIDDEHIIKFM